MAALFHTKIQELTTKEEQEKALKETIIKVKDSFSGTEDAGTSTDGSCRIPADDEGAKSSGRAAETAYFH